MPSWTHLGVGIGLLALLIAGAAKAIPKRESSGGGGSALRVKDAEVEGRRYHVIARGSGQFEVLSRDDVDAWVVFDASDPGPTVKPLAAGPHASDVLADMQKFPSNLFT